MDVRHALPAAALLLALCVTPSLAAGPIVAGHAQEVRGSASARLGAKARELNPPAEIYVGDSLSTAEGSRAVLQLGRDTQLRMGANASVRIDKFLVDRGGTISVGEGPVLIDKEPGTAARPLSLQGDFGLIVVHGTRVFVGPSQGALGVFVSRGEVVVMSGGRSVSLREGQGTDVGRRGAPPKPAKIWSQERVDAALASVN